MSEQFLTETKEAIAQMLVKNPVLTVNIIYDDYARSTTIDRRGNVTHQATDHSVWSSSFRKILERPILKSTLTSWSQFETYGENRTTPRQWGRPQPRQVD